MRKGDDSNAFGNRLIKVNRPKNTENLIITKVVFQCGYIRKEYNNPDFPFFIDLNSEESKLLKVGENPASLKIYDENNLGYTCKGSIPIPGERQVVQDRCEYARDEF